MSALGQKQPCPLRAKSGHSGQRMSDAAMHGYPARLNAQREQGIPASLLRGIFLSLERAQGDRCGADGEGYWPNRRCAPDVQRPNPQARLAANSRSLFGTVPLWSLHSDRAPSRYTDSQPASEHVRMGLRRPTEGQLQFSRGRKIRKLKVLGRETCQDARPYPGD